MIKFNTKKFALAAGAVLALATSQAFASPSFTFSPVGNGNPAPTSPNVTIDQFNGLSSELITFGANQTAVGANSASGYLYFNNASYLGDTAINFGRLGNLATVGTASGSVGFYITFDLTNHLVSSVGGVNTYALDSLSFSFYVDKNNDTTFSKPVASDASPVTAVRTGGFSDDSVIASGTLKADASGNFANISQQSGGVTVGLTSTENFLNVSSSYFTFPNPFYSLALDSFNNTGNTYTQSASGHYGAISGANGQVTFLNVPEPSTLALFGIAAVGLGLSAKRRRKA